MVELMEVFTCDAESIHLVWVGVPLVKESCLNPNLPIFHNYGSPSETLTNLFLAQGNSGRLKDSVWATKWARSSSREVRIRVPFFCNLFFSWGVLPTKKGVRKGTGGPRLGILFGKFPFLAGRGIQQTNHFGRSLVRTVGCF